MKVLSLLVALYFLPLEAWSQVSPHARPRGAGQFQRHIASDGHKTSSTQRSISTDNRFKGILLKPVDLTCPILRTENGDISLANILPDADLAWGEPHEITGTELDRSPCGHGVAVHGQIKRSK